MTRKVGTIVPGVPESGKSSRPWTGSEIDAVWQHPDMSSQELASMLGRTPQAVRHIRYRYGRWNPDAVPLCQKCGEHPVYMADADARRWGLCQECACREKEWRDRNAERLRKANAARRQRKHKRKGMGGD